MKSGALLDIEGLRVAFPAAGARPVDVVDGVGFSINEGECSAFVGESGSGKSMTALSLLRLVPPPGNISARRIAFDGIEIGAMSPEKFRLLRGGRIGFVFQDSMTALNPTMTIGRQIAETVREHLGLDAAAADRKAIELLDTVSIPDPARRAREFPHRLSGGMRQRVMIAIAISCNPKLLIADEPTTALDVTVQAQILELLGRLRRERGMAVMLITHDLGVVASMADQVNVMYAGRIVEKAPVREFFAAPRHPYSAALMACVPRMDFEAHDLVAIPGMPPDMRELDGACRFLPRCAAATAACGSPPPVDGAGTSRTVECWNPRGRAI